MVETSFSCVFFEVAPDNDLHHQSLIAVVVVRIAVVVIINIVVEAIVIVIVGSGDTERMSAAITTRE